MFTLTCSLWYIWDYKCCTFQSSRFCVNLFCASDTSNCTQWTEWILQPFSYIQWVQRIIPKEVCLGVHNSTTLSASWPYRVYELIIRSVQQLCLIYIMTLDFGFNSSAAWTRGVPSALSIVIWANNLYDE